MTHKIILTSCFLAGITTVCAQNNGPVDDAEILKLFQKKTELVKKGAFKERYTIQLDYDRPEAAEKTKKKYDALNYEWDCEMVWVRPYVAVRAGAFKNRLEADRALLKIKELFPKARVMKP